jgi:hypothetical protein
MATILLNTSSTTIDRAQQAIRMFLPLLRIGADCVRVGQPAGVTDCLLVDAGDGPSTELLQALATAAGGATSTTTRHYDRINWDILWWAAV